MYFENRQGQKIFFQNWLKPQAKYNLIVIHGVNEHSGRYKNLIEALQKNFGNSLNIFAYDHRGHGHSEGKKGYINKFSDYSDDLEDFIYYINNSTKRSKLPFIIFAHSMGGLVALDLITTNKNIEQRLNIKCLAVSAPGLLPSLKIAWWKKLFTPIISIFLPTFSLPTPELGYKGDNLCYDHLTARWFNEFNRARTRVISRLGEISLPILIFHSKVDQLVFVSGSKMLYEQVRSKHKKLIILDAKTHAPFDIEAPSNKIITNEIAIELNKFFNNLNEK